MTGETGPTGETGMTGQNGPTGHSGSAGPTGTSGASGTNGTVGNTGPGGDTGTTGPTGIVGPTGVSGTTGMVGITGTNGPSGNAGPTGWIGNTGIGGKFEQIVPTNVAIQDTAESTRTVFSTPIHNNMYVSDNPLDTYARASGYATTEMVYTFGIGRAQTYVAVGGNTTTYGTSVSKDGMRWSALANTDATHPATQIVWDGFKWLAVRNAELLYGYTDQSFVVVDVSNTRLSSVETNGQLYVGVGADGVGYSYDGIRWTLSSSGTALIHNTATYQNTRVVWNGAVWVICGDGSGHTLIYSSDGKTWTGAANSRTIFDASGGAMDVAWNGRVFVATGISANGYATATSVDGIEWSNVVSL
jgi:hypothetical protein